MGSSFSIPSNGPNHYSRDLNNTSTNDNSTAIGDSERHVSIATDRGVTTDTTLTSIVEAAQPQTSQASMPQYFVVGSGGSNPGARGHTAQTRPPRRSASHPSIIPASSNESSSSAQVLRRPSLSSRLHDAFQNLRSSSEEHRERTRREDRQLREEVDDGERVRREGCGSSSEPGLAPMDMDDGNATPIPMDLDDGHAGEGTAPARPRINIARRTSALRFSRFRPRSQSLSAQPASSSTTAEVSASMSEAASTDRQPRVNRELSGSLTQPTSSSGGDDADGADGADSTDSGEGGDNESARPARHRVMERMLATAVAAAWSTISNGSTGRGLFGRGQNNNRVDDQGLRHQTDDVRRNGAIQGVEDGLDEIISLLTSGLSRPGGGAANNGNGDVETGVAGVAEVLQAGETGRPPRFQPTADGRGFIINAGDGSTMRMFRLPSGGPAPPANGPDGRPRMVPVVFIAIRTVSPTRDAAPHETPTEINAQPQPTGANPAVIVENNNVNQALPATMQAAEQSSQDARARRTISWIVYIVGGSVPPGHPIASWGLPPSGNGETVPGGATNPDPQQNRNISPGANPFQALFSDNPTYEDLLLLSMLLGPARSPTTTQSEIDAAIPMQKWSEEVKNGLLGDSEKCRVCLSDYEEGEEVRILGCKHGFHRECIDKWLTEGSNKCPLCRSTPVGNQQETPITATE